MRKEIKKTKDAPKKVSLKKVLDYDRMVLLFEFEEKEQASVLQRLRNSAVWQAVALDGEGNIFVTREGDTYL